MMIERARDVVWWLLQGTVVQGDIYVSAMPVDLINKLIPDRMRERWYVPHSHPLLLPPIQP